VILPVRGGLPGGIGVHTIALGRFPRLALFDELQLERGSVLGFARIDTLLLQLPGTPEELKRLFEARRADP
jgi:hypothetical protein